MLVVAAWTNKSPQYARLNFNNGVEGCGATHHKIVPAQPKASREPGHSVGGTLGAPAGQAAEQSLPARPYAHWSQAAPVQAARQVQSVRLGISGSPVQAPTGGGLLHLRNGTWVESTEFSQKFSRLLLQCFFLLFFWLSLG